MASLDIDGFTIVGFVGAAIIIAAYFANQTGRLASDDRRFPLWNLAGAIMILASLVTQWNFPSAVIEAFWIAISLYGLVRTRSG
jgi:hypothetical protein